MTLRSLAVLIVLAAPAAAEVSPYCRAAHGKYLALFHQKEWNVESYKAFISRFNEVSRKVDVTVAETRPVAVALALESWCETYKHADRRGAEGWEGVFQLFKRERESYLTGREMAARQFEALTSMPPEAREKELKRKVDAKSYFPGEMGKESKLTVRDVLYVFLGTDARAAVSGGATPREEVAQVAARTLGAARSAAGEADFFLREPMRAEVERDALAPLETVKISPAVLEALTQAAPGIVARTSPSVSRASSVPAVRPQGSRAGPEQASAPVPAPATVAPAPPAAAPGGRGAPPAHAMAAPVRSADPLASLGMPQRSALTGATFSFAAAGAEGKDLLVAARTGSEAGPVDRVRLRYDGDGKTVRWIKWGEGSGPLGAYWGYSAIPGHSDADHDLTQADRIELLPGGLVRAAVPTMKRSANRKPERTGVESHCLDLLSGGQAACPAAGEKRDEILSLPVSWGTEIKSLDGRLLEVQWKEATDGGGSYLRLKSGSWSIGATETSYKLGPDTIFELKLAGRPARRYLAAKGLEWRKDWPPSEDQIGAQALELPSGLGAIRAPMMLRVVQP